MGSNQIASPKVRKDKIKLPVPFEEAVGDILKVKPPPEKKKRRGKRLKPKEES